jgi:hypothetical protein
LSYLAGRTARAGIYYVILCGLCLAWSRSQRLALCPDWRFAALRELMKPREAPADVLLLGSSRSVRGLVPDAFERELESIGAPAMRALNLSVNGTPRHANCLELEDWLDDHPSPKVVCLEVGTADLIDWPHQMLPRFMGPLDAARMAAERPYFVASAADAKRFRINEPEGQRTDLFRELERSGMHFGISLAVLGRGPEDIVRAAADGAINAFEAFGRAREAGEPRPLAKAWSELGNPYWAAEPPIEASTLQQQVQDRGWYRVDPDSELARNGKPGVVARASKVSIEEANAKARTESFDDTPRFGATRLYTRRIAQLCRERGIRLVFMFLPGFREDVMSPSQVEFYRRYGELFAPDMSVLQREENYQDLGHLSIEGARWYSAELARFIAK